MHRRSPRRRMTLLWPVSAVAAGCLLAAGSYGAAIFADLAIVASLPRVPPVPATEALADRTLVRIRVTTDAGKAWVQASPAAVRFDWNLWRQLYLEDWDRVPRVLRTRALSRMLRSYRELIDSPVAWDRMTPADWDAVPHPIRAIAFHNMCGYWTDYYGLDSRLGISPATFGSMSAAVVMSESWFDHRAVNVNVWGNRDLGLAQASDGARQRLREWFRSGAVDVWLEDDDYFDPFNATRFVVIWLRALLTALDGDLDAAVRAYHRGLHRAEIDDAVGAGYLSTVKNRHRNYVAADARSDTWVYLWTRSARQPLRSVSLNQWAGGVPSPRADVGQSEQRTLRSDGRPASN